MERRTAMSQSADNTVGSNTGAGTMKADSKGAGQDATGTPETVTRSAPSPTETAPVETSPPDTGLQTGEKPHSPGSDLDPDLAAIRAMMREASADGEIAAPGLKDRARPATAPSAPAPSPALSPSPAAPMANRREDSLNTSIKTMIATAEADTDRAQFAEPAPSPADPPANPARKKAPRTKRQGPGIGRRIFAECRKTVGLLARFLWQVLRHPRTPRVLAIALIAAVTVAHPLFILALLLVAGLVAAITYFSVGPEAVDAFIIRRFQRLKARDPAKAEQLYSRAVRGIDLLNKAIDRLPERWTQGLYLPDLNPEQTPPEKMREDPFARLEAVADAGPGRAADLLPPLEPPRRRRARVMDPITPSEPRRPPRRLRP
ncbi:hypothetical protein XMM379_001689 [Aliiroseovarius sp. xm-m-379]|uniref:hypothetical protein n=1 Tax=unclassified Aliiroseovarius TaxID=2623558 RepID=UPI001568D9A8|nr:MULTISPECIES: hypothetical protein [unclassified Aliiroseovarius]NRP13629.1 hypothetical protein [Aliiroseovarius sp. xm-d-517]NRP24999.1 hypothetical protein [Aliiroseovarius sp. xm-m-379]NRP31480.1 hypothetical protein [Aliiroseovarius sp. xm-m-314]NRP33798.1 hypothetical protein [Aliiroseovarius sp. xm-a-104]NRP41231.1 hypothetical protein [Aliiroseovarius sp. xm-m-339-2]